MGLFIFLLAAGLLIYFTPIGVAVLRGHRQIVAIAALNLFLGWTLLGWVGALVWALVNQSGDDAPRRSAGQNGAAPLLIVGIGALLVGAGAVGFTAIFFHGFDSPPVDQQGQNSGTSTVDTTGAADANSSGSPSANEATSDTDEPNGVGAATSPSTSTMTVPPKPVQAVRPVVSTPAATPVDAALTSAAPVTEANAPEQRARNSRLAEWDDDPNWHDDPAPAPTRRDLPPY